MRKLYDEFFHISKHGKIREKVMLTRAATTVATLIVCLAAMGLTAYAYFSCNVTSGPNNIKTASFEADVSIAMTAPTTASVSVAKEGDLQTADLEAGEYTIKLAREDNAAKKGFCVITIGEKKYYTDQIGVDVDKNLTDAVVEFDLKLSESAKIEISSHWGTSMYYGYKDAGRTEIFIKNDDDLDLTTKTLSGDDETEEITDQSEEEPADTPTEPEASENSTTPSAETTESEETTSPETTEPSDSTETTEPTDSTESTEPSDSPESTEPTDSETTPEFESAESEETESAETPPASEDTETAGTTTPETTE